MAEPRLRDEDASMNQLQQSPSSNTCWGADIQRYLATGTLDPHYQPGRSKQAREALIAAVLGSTRGYAHYQVPRVNLKQLTRSPVEPMVRGLFPRREQDVVLDLLESSVVVVSSDNIEDLLRQVNWDCTAWELAAIYLHSVGASLLSPEMPVILGKSEATTCYICANYFDPEHEPFSDYLVHEVAHVFHNWKRERVGLPYTRNREWLLEIDFHERENFALACEAYRPCPRTQLERDATAATCPGVADG